MAIHFDVDTVDSNEIVLGLGAVPDGLTSSQLRRVVADVSGATDVVGLTVAEFFPRHVMHLRQMLEGFPLTRRPCGRAGHRAEDRARPAAAAARRWLRRPGALVERLPSPGQPS